MTGKRRLVVANLDLCFEAGSHLLRLERCADGWAVTVDGLSAGSRFPSQAEAWQAGVRAGFALDGPAPGPRTLHRASADQPGDPDPDPIAPMASRG
jgi:hypothetical protein